MIDGSKYLILFQVFGQQCGDWRRVVEEGTGRINGDGKKIVLESSKNFQLKLRANLSNARTPLGSSSAL